MTADQFDELVAEFERECYVLQRMYSSHEFDPNRPYQLQEVNSLRRAIRLAFRDAISGRWPKEAIERKQDER